ncbi:MAG: hypothetical protein DI539_11695 [Flavobacterium psychrophilum]|nr:MAG: hypothetical protein DI539_11695 [Flavobacterium psychrophilum]
MIYLLSLAVSICLYVCVTYTVNKQLLIAYKKASVLSDFLESAISKYIDNGYQNKQIFKDVTFNCYLDKIKIDRERYLSKNAYREYKTLNIVRKFRCVRFLNQYSSEVKPVLKGLLK